MRNTCLSCYHLQTVSNEILYLSNHLRRVLDDTPPLKINIISYLIEKIYR